MSGLLKEPLDALECRRLNIEWKEPLLAFFRALSDPEDSRQFHPHPFTAEALEEIIQTARNDLYYVLVEGTKVLGYGMLRGWDQGYEVPSLGIAIHPCVRGTGLSKLLMRFLESAARRRGANQLRLRVNPDNKRARSLYEGLGYRFGSEEDGYLVGRLQLD